MMVIFFITSMCYFVKIHQVRCDICIILSVLFVNKKPLEIHANYLIYIVSIQLAIVSYYWTLFLSPIE